MKVTLDGAEEGVVAKYGWKGDKVGEGKMEITESKPPEKINIRLEFAGAMAGVCPTEFTFQSAGDETLVTWTMSGKNESLIKKAFCMFMNLDAMLGKDFEEGLAKMKEVAEKEVPAPTAPSEPMPPSPPGEATPATGEK
jgi:hypothetical protein